MVIVDSGMIPLFLDAWATLACMTQAFLFRPPLHSPSLL